MLFYFVVPVIVPANKIHVPVTAHDKSNVQAIVHANIIYVQVIVHANKIQVPV
jgi:hypothetical protein